MSKLLNLFVVLLPFFVDGSEGECVQSGNNAKIHNVHTSLADAVEHYEREGYAILRGVFDDSPNLVKELSDHVDFLLKKFPDIPPEHFQ